MSKKAKQVLSILGRNNATADCIEKTQSMLDTKKNARDILDKIVKKVLFLQSISEAKINNAVDFLTGGAVNLDTKLCVKCFKVKEISEFYLTPTKKILHYWCKDCRRAYDKIYKQKIRGR